MTVPAGLVTLLTDFGHGDPYVGVMKGAMLRRCPTLGLIDLCHEIAPQCIGEARFWLERSFRWFPTGTVHLVVVDPGVGSARRPVAVEVHDHFFVAPDNGVLDGVLADLGPVEARVLDPVRVGADTLSNTFHGRDLFGPAAALLAGRVQLLEALGEPCRLEAPAAAVSQPNEGSLTATVVTVDHFGNLITETPGHLLQGGRWVARVDDRILPLARTYAEVGHGELLALVGSFGTVELACNGGSAAQQLRVGRGTRVLLERR